MPLLNCSHLVIATDDVTRYQDLFSELFGLTAHFSNRDFLEFVLPSGFRLAFFRPVGKAATYFRAQVSREGSSLGLAVSDVEACYQCAQVLSKNYQLTFSGPPKDHPWGEKSFLLIDFDGNRWEITQTSDPKGILPTRDFGAR